MLLKKRYVKNIMNSCWLFVVGFFFLSLSMMSDLRTLPSSTTNLANVVASSISSRNFSICLLLELSSLNSMSKTESGY